MAPPPLLDLLDWRVPYVPLLAMISVSVLSAWLALEPGLRLPRSRFLPSPDATANDEMSRPSTTVLARTSGPWDRILRNISGSLPVGSPFPHPTGRRLEGCGARSPSHPHRNVTCR